ncbi:MAG: choice-of-anchor D domain-containing protein, partial [Planctomycetes bacterium]|nr:choice-of-anchor D domain-containing protein [Planctomycetota bacterium]
MANKSRIVLLCLMFFAFSIYVGCSSDSPTLKLTPSKLDFGTINIGDTFSIDVVLKNKYGKSMIISNVSISGTSDYAITAGGTLPINLDKNAEHTLTITFTPTVDGPIVGLISFTHDASSKPKETDLEGIGVAVPRIDIPVTLHDYGIRLFNTTLDQNFEIENVGTADMTISQLTFTGAGASEFNVSAGGAIPITVIPGATHTITVQFAPTTAGNFPAELEISHDAVNEISPSKITVNGVGVLTAPKIEVDRTSPWDFGSVATTMPSVQTLEISSIGSDPLTIASITFTTGAEFTLDKVEDSNGNVITLPEIVAVSDKIIVFIKFEPTANTTFNDTLTVMHNGLYNPAPLDIALAGEGRDEISRTFTYTGSAEQWTVPAGVASIVVECYGAEGGSNYSRVPGKGGKAEATVPVTPGDTINVYVGGKGGGTGTGVGGWNGGGLGGGYNNYTAGGGGASDIRIGGTALTDRKVVGGAGGGAAWDTQPGRPLGGAGGGLTGGNGTAGYNSGPGLGGTQTAGGAGGRSATPGTLGVGGRGVGTSLGGAGGGGGYYGGGGGYCSGGG